MSEYIKKEDAIESARALLFCYGSDNITDEQLDEYAEEFMNDDDNTIVEIVRCKDCKYWDSDCIWCNLWGNTQEYGNGFCSYGERKDNE